MDIALQHRADIRNSVESDTTQNVIGAVPSNAEILVIGRNRNSEDRWLAVSYNDIFVGWVSENYVELGEGSNWEDLPVYTEEQISTLMGN